MLVLTKKVYVGDSATLSFLQLIRVIVDNVAGESDFTLDPRRHRIVEESITLPADLRRTHLLPDKQTAEVLVHSFLTNVRFLTKFPIHANSQPDERHSRCLRS